MGGRTILAFVPRGQKFTQCSSYTEVTAQVDCKVTMFTSVTSVVVIPELVVRGTPNYFWDWSIAAHMQRKICCCLSATLQPLSFVHNASNIYLKPISTFHPFSRVCYNQAVTGGTGISLPAACGSSSGSTAATSAPTATTTASSTAGKWGLMEPVGQQKSNETRFCAAVT